MPNSPTSPRHIFRSSLLVGGFFTLNKIVALARQIIIGRVFGVSPLLDAFNAANNLPDLLFTVISGGALAIAFIPVLAGVFDRDGRAAGWQLFSHVANLAFLVTGVIAVVVALFARQIVTSRFGIAPGFSPEQQVLVIDLMRLNLISTLIFSLSGLVIGGLQANQHFLLPAAAPVLYNLGQIFGALVLAPDEFPLGGLAVPTLGLGIHGLVYGVILGAVLHLGVQLPGLWRYGFRWTAAVSLRHPGVLAVLRLMGPRIIALGAFQYSELVRDNLASYLPGGSVTALQYGWFIMQVPQTIIGTAIGTALLPTLATLVARNDLDALRRTLTTAIRAMVALTLPVAVALLWLTRPFVVLVFEGGAFDAAATDLVVFATQLYLAGLVGHSLLEIASRTFYAWEDAITPTVAAIIAMVLQIGLALWFLNLEMGYTGLALANSLAFTAQALGLLWIGLRRWQLFDLRVVLVGVAKVAIATGVMAAGLVLFVMRAPASNVMVQLLGGGVMVSGATVQLLGGGVVVVVLYCGSAMLLKLDEVRQLPAMLLKQQNS